MASSPDGTIRFSFCFSQPPSSPLAPGLILLLRWAWAMALGAVFLLSAYDLWIFASSHQGPALVQGLLNLVFFLYLVRPEVRSKLR